MFGLKPLAEYEFVLTVFQKIDVDEIGVTATCHWLDSPMSVQLKLTDVGVTSVIATAVILLEQLDAQSKLKQVLLFTFDRINAAGCGPNPSLKLIPTPEIKWQ